MNASPVKVELLSTIINPLYNLVVSAEYRSKKSWARENTCQWEIPSYFDDQNAQLCGVTEVTWCGSCGVPVCKRHARVVGVEPYCLECAEVREAEIKKMVADLSGGLRWPNGLQNY